MQTFLPYPDFTKSAQCLDNRRLGKQRVECLQILKALSDPAYGWQNHPAVKMWHGHENALTQYGFRVCSEWILRGFKDTCHDKIYNIFGFKFQQNGTFYVPDWLVRDDAVCASHRSNLLRKDPVHYGQFGWTEPHDLPYIWPV